MSTISPYPEAEAKAAVLIEALPYIQRFRGAVFVVKYGGSFVEEPAAREKVAMDLVFLAAVGIRVVLVHGGGKAISRAMAEAGLEPVFCNGLRVTDAATIELVEKSLNNVINVEIGTELRKCGGRPLRVIGQNVFRCEKLATTPEADLGFVGQVTDVLTEEVQVILQGGGLPVVSPVGADEHGQLFNINADTAAAHLAVALGARRLVYLCDVPGLMRNPLDPATLISSLKVEAVEGLRQEGIIASGMAPKVDSAVHALQGGVRRVHLINGRLPHSLLLEIFTHSGIGTEIVQTHSEEES